jgi:hypothetical protein
VEGDRRLVRSTTDLHRLRSLMMQCPRKLWSTACLTNTRVMHAGAGVGKRPRTEPQLSGACLLTILPARTFIPQVPKLSSASVTGHVEPDVSADRLCGIRPMARVIFGRPFSSRDAPRSPDVVRCPHLSRPKQLLSGAPKFHQDGEKSAFTEMTGEEVLEIIQWCGFLSIVAPTRSQPSRYRKDEWIYRLRRQGRSARGRLSWVHHETLRITQTSLFKPGWEAESINSSLPTEPLMAVGDRNRLRPPFDNCELSSSITGPLDDDPVFLLSSPLNCSGRLRWRGEPQQRMVRCCIT